MTAAPDDTPDDIDALRAALAAEQVARREAEARASGAEALVLQLKLLIAKLKTKPIMWQVSVRPRAPSLATDVH